MVLVGGARFEVGVSTALFSEQSEQSSAVARGCVPSPLLLAMAASVAARAYDICHVTSVIKGDVEGVWVCYKNLTHFIADLRVCLSKSEWAKGEESKSEQFWGKNVFLDKHSGVLCIFKLGWL